MTIETGVFRRLTETKLIAVVTIDQVDQARRVCEALLDGGVHAMELTLRTPNALKSLRIVASEFPDMIVGAGTLVTPEQIDQVVDAGAQFGVSPGLNGAVLEAARERDLPFAPGIMTPSELDAALIHHRCRFMKFFPAESSGGLKHLESIVTPYAHLEPRFIPLGGVNRSNLEHYLRCRWVAAIGGSWIAARSLIENGDWNQIRTNAAAARELVNSIRA
ncbi:MAG: bifunctional 4-hydroxy-2-oxoglutarate aldolase/2-dehydro-3-deoxy-phosphogluconate aldolase [Planctomycetota bacterium]